MGGTPKTAMNLVSFPVKTMDIGILRRIIQGGVDKLTEAGVVLVGGHSVEDKELKYGLSVTGFVHPQRVLTKKNLQADDRLILTKPLGTGIVNTAIKAGMAPAELVERVTGLMAALNRTAAEVMAGFDVHACTDVTGFGLLGHLAEMVSGSGKGVRVFSRSVPVIPEALEFASMGLIPAGAYKNREFREAMVDFKTDVDRSLRDVLFDPQTSGGLLIAVRGTQADKLVESLGSSGVLGSAEIGEVLTGPEEKIWVV